MGALHVRAVAAIFMWLLMQRTAPDASLISALLARACWRATVSATARRPPACRLPRFGKAALAERVWWRVGCVTWGLLVGCPQVGQPSG